MPLNYNIDDDAGQDVNNDVIKDVGLGCRQATYF